MINCILATHKVYVKDSPKGLMCSWVQFLEVNFEGSVADMLIGGEAWLEIHH